MVWETEVGGGVSEREAKGGGTYPGSRQLSPLAETNGDRVTCQLWNSERGLWQGVGRAYDGLPGQWPHTRAAESIMILSCRVEQRQRAGRVCKVEYSTIMCNASIEQIEKKQEKRAMPTYWHGREGIMPRGIPTHRMCRYHVWRMGGKSRRYSV